MKAMLLGIIAVATGLASFESRAEDAPGWCKSKWGPDDEIGAANLLTSKLAMNAVKLVKTGKTYPLAVETNSRTPAFPPRTWALIIAQPGQAGGASLGPTKTNYNDDIYMGWVGTGTQIDGLGHIGIDNVYYNCFKNSDFAQANGLRKLGVEKIPNFVTRGVVLDMTGGKALVPEGTAFNRKEIDDVAKQEGVEIRRGDVVLFYTGWLTLVGKDDKRFISGEPGLGKDGAEYLASKEVVAVGADTWALEVIPFERGSGTFEVHQTLIPRNGIYILENINTAELVRDKAYEFMFVLGTPRITGAVQGIINPTAIR
ncbi:MAG TPA: cyclase family protein [Myxococcaceae bacterium]|nr:cyclase family protein [Myxococcaceae bacterium]